MTNEGCEFLLHLDCGRINQPYLINGENMKNLVIVSFPAKPETINNLKETLKSALPDTRNFDGCISVKTFIEESTNTIHLIEDWETLEHQQKYLAWRIDTGLLDLLEPLLDGGASSLKATICGPEHTDI